MPRGEAKPQVSRSMPRWARPGHALARPRRGQRGRLVGLGLFVVLVGVWLVARLALPLEPVRGAAMVSDGDSLRFDAVRVRIVGIDAPELDQSCWRPDGTEWACGQAARRHLAGLAARGEVLCAPEGEDEHGRLLARCEVNGEDLGAAMVRGGLAVAYGRYEPEEAAARSAGSGIWAGRFTDPRAWRDAGGAADEQGSSGVMAHSWGVDRRK